MLAQATTRYCDSPMTRPATCAEAALHNLCADYGYCLSAEETEAVLRNAPLSVDEFTDSVLAAEGIDAAFIDRKAREQVRAVVADWLLDGDTRGTKSGLPRFP
jgi:hypothetical protein